MATMGPTATRDAEQFAGNLLKLARSEAGVSQRQLAERSGIPQSSIARIETFQRQPSIPVLIRLLAAVDLELRTRLEKYDDHDDVLDQREARLTPSEREQREAAQDSFSAALRGSAASTTA